MFLSVSFFFFFFFFVLFCFVLFCLIAKKKKNGHMHLGEQVPGIIMLN